MMKKKLAGVLSFALASVFTFAGCGGGGNTSNNNNS